MNTDFLKQLLPWIGAAATGNVPALVTMAAAEVSKHLGVTVPADSIAVTKAVNAATPEQLLALKNADADFALKMQDLGFKHVESLLSSSLAGVADARAREVSLKDSITPRVLALFAVACFLGLIFAVLKGVAPADGMKDTFLILVGAAIAVFKDVYGYYFGSSSGSAAKDVTIAASSKGV